MNLVLTLCDAGDSVVMFAPYYFNAYMSFQMTGITNILMGQGNPETLYPDAGKTLHDLLPNNFFTSIRLRKQSKSFGLFTLLSNFHFLFSIKYTY